MRRHPLNWMTAGACTAALLGAIVHGCDRDAGPVGTGERSGETDKPAESFADARPGFKTRLLRQEKDGDPAPTPPAELFRLVRYDSPAGKMAAYLSVPPAGAGKRPAILWLFGGFSNGIGETAWEPATPENDQSAAAFREAGVIMMYPSFRGGNDNPGVKEGFFGELDDVLAAADFLARQEHVDPTRIYLGGHSTGGTLALLVAAAAPAGRFRAVFGFGPVADPGDYGQEYVPFDVSDPRERAMRAPAQWIWGAKTPVFVIEGAGGNLDAFQSLAGATRGNPIVRFHGVDTGDHFNILGPATKLIAAKILRDEGPATNIAFTDQELGRMMRQ